MTHSVEQGSAGMKLEEIIKRVLHTKRVVEVDGGWQDEIQCVDNCTRCALEAYAASEREWEPALREWLWLGHGHGLGYGDDGEMQCCKCKEWDYKRASLSVLVPQALAAQKQAALEALNRIQVNSKPSRVGAMTFSNRKRAG